MYLYTKKGRQILRDRGLYHDYFSVMIIGAGPDAFIGPTAWIPNLQASRCFNLEYAAPSRDHEKVADFFVEYGLDEADVSKDYKTLVKHAFKETEDHLVVCICTETGYHAEQIKYCIEAGVKQIILDKPPVANWAEWKEVMELADEHGCLLLISYQHTMNSPTAEMALRVASHLKKGNPVESVQIGGIFIQDWLYDAPSEKACRQAWRLNDKWCGLLDIGTHAADGACTIAGSPIKTVLSSAHSKARISKLYKPGLDNGEMEVQFKNGINGFIKYHQAEPGHADDIHWYVRLEDSNGKQISIMWRMAWGCDTLWISKTEGASCDDKSLWEAHLRGHSKEFSDEANNAFEITPAGHTQGWSDMWKIFFTRCFRAILQHKEDNELANEMIPVAKGYCPDFRRSGGNTMAFFDAAVRCHETQKACDVPVTN